MKILNKLTKADKLSMERTFLSSERTLLAYIRTAFASFLFGIALLQLFSNNLSEILGFIFLAIGVIFVIIGVISYPLRNKRIRELRL